MVDTGVTVGRPLRLLLATTATATTFWWQLPWLPGRFAGLKSGFAPLAVADIVVTVTVLVGLLHWLRRRQRPSLRPFGLSLAGGIVIVAAASGAPAAPFPMLAAAVTLHVVLLFLLFRLYASALISPPTVAAALVLGLAAQLPLVLQQTVRQTTSPMARFLGWPSDYTAGAPGASVLLIATGQRWLRAYGPFFHPNILGGYLAVEALLLLGLIVAAWPRLRDHRARALVGLPVGLSLLCLLLAASRSAWLGLLAGLVTTAVGWRRGAEPAAFLLDRRGLTGFAALIVLPLVIGFGLLRPPLLERFNPGSNRLEAQSVQERLFFDRLGLDLLATHPLLGVGAGNVNQAELIYSRGTLTPTPVHDVPLLLAVELGPAGALAWLLAATCILGQTWRSPGRWTVAFAAALIAAGTAGLFDHYFWTFPAARTTMAVLAGAWAAALQQERAAYCNPPGTSLRRMRGGTDDATGAGTITA
jgi:hypothetical protein